MNRMAILAGCAFALGLFIACGNGSSESIADAPPIPKEGDPAFGVVGNALISDRGHSVDETVDMVWVGFSREDHWAALLAFVERGEDPPFIGGRLVADPARHLGFFFDPETTRVAEGIAVIDQTALDALKANPVERNWMLSAAVERVVPGG